MGLKCVIVSSLVVLVACDGPTAEKPPPPTGSAEVPTAAPRARGAHVAGSPLAEQDRMGSGLGTTEDPDDPDLPMPGPAPMIKSPDGGGVEL